MIPIFEGVSMKKIVLGLIVLVGFASISSADGAATFKKCSGCHGAQGEKSALGKSKIINQLSKANIVAALNGYKDGSYGGGSKAVMKSQVAKLSDTDIKEIADLIGK